MDNIVYEDYMPFNGYKRVLDGKRWNFINKDEILLSPCMWFDMAYCFSDGFARVVWNSKLNYLDTNGKLVSQEWFDFGGDYHNGIALVNKNGKSNAINRNGELLLDTWYDGVLPYKDENFLQVCIKGEWQLVEVNI